MKIMVDISLFFARRLQIIYLSEYYQGTKFEFQLNSYAFYELKSFWDKEPFVYSLMIEHSIESYYLHKSKCQTELHIKLVV